MMRLGGACGETSFILDPPPGPMPASIAAGPTYRRPGEGWGFGGAVKISNAPAYVTAQTGPGITMRSDPDDQLNTACPPRRRSTRPNIEPCKPADFRR